MPAKEGSYSEIDSPRKSAASRPDVRIAGAAGCGCLRDRNGSVVFIRTALPFRIRPSRRIGTSSVRGDEIRRGCSVRPSRVGGRRGRNVGRFPSKSDFGRSAQASENRSSDRGRMFRVPARRFFPSGRSLSGGFDRPAGGRRRPTEGPAARVFAVREPLAGSRCR